MKKAVSCLLLALSLPVRAELKQCDDADFVYNNQRSFVVAQKLKLIEARLRRIDAEAYRRNDWPEPTDTAGTWRDSQKLWVKFTEADCRFESEPLSVSLGSGYGREYWQCIAERYDRRLHQAEDMIRRMRE